MNDAAAQLTGQPAGPAQDGATLRVAGTVPFFRWTQTLLNRLVHFTDLAVFLALALALHAGFQGHAISPAWLNQALITIGLAVVFHYALHGLDAYRLDAYLNGLEPYRDLLLGFAAINAVAFVARLLFGPAFLGDFRLFLLWEAGCFVLLGVARAILVSILHRPAVREALSQRIVVIGATRTAEAVLTQWGAGTAEQAGVGLADSWCRIDGVFDDRGADRRPEMLAGVKVLGTVDTLCDLAQHSPIDLIVIALPWHRAMQIFSIIERVQWICADIVVPFEEGGFNPPAATVRDVSGLRTLQVVHRPMKDLRALVKIIEDYVVGTIGLVMVSPIMLVAAIAIKLDSAGPVLFRQTRVGFNKEYFSIYKFRTMRFDPTDDGSHAAERKDARVTRVGRVLRRLSIDELPQLLNVLRGNMSVVGPRPHVPSMRVGDTTYFEAVREYAARHRIKPGITGWAQINGFRGGAYTVERGRRGVDLDLQYIENWSLWFDLKIMLRTLAVGMSGRHVY